MSGKTFKVFTIRVNYKTSIQEEFDCTEFSVSGTTGGPLSYNWEAYTPKGKGARPVFLNPDEIESVWQVSSRTVLKDKEQ